MAVYVTFFKPAGLGSAHAPSLGKMRKLESVSVGSTSTASAADGEAAYVMNNESTAVYVAAGSTPVANTATATDATSAGFVLAAGAFMALSVNTGDKIAVATAS